MERHLERVDQRLLGVGAVIPAIVHVAADAMIFELTVNLCAQQQSLSLGSLDAGIEPGAVGFGRQDYRHPGMDTLDFRDGRCSDYRAAGDAQIVIVGPYASEAEAGATWQLQQPGILLAVLFTGRPFEIAIGRDQAATGFEALTESAGSVDGFDTGVEHSGFGQFLGEERHQPPAAPVELHVPGLVEVNEIHLLRWRDVVARLQVGRRDRMQLVAELVERVKLAPGHLIGESSAHWSALDQKVVPTSTSSFSLEAAHHTLFFKRIKNGLRVAPLLIDE